MKKKDLTVEDLKYFANDLIKLYNNKYPEDRISMIDQSSQVGVFEIGSTVARIAGKLGVHAGLSYGIDEISVKIGELKRKLEDPGW
jgi:transposase-like protein